MYFQWDEAYSVLDDEIDRQHQKLFEIGKKISDLVLNEDVQDRHQDILQILHEMNQYTLEHFLYEEKLMEQQGYPELEAHKLSHGFAIKRLQRVSEGFTREYQKDGLIELIHFISGWISDHIYKVDMKYKVFLESKKRQP